MTEEEETDFLYKFGERWCIYRKEPVTKDEFTYEIQKRRKGVSEVQDWIVKE